MAFEYMMTMYLLTGQTKKFLNNIGRLKDVGYDTIPRHYEEALAILAVEGMTPQAMHGYQPSPDAVSKAARFKASCKRFGSRATDAASRKAATEAARKALRGSFGHTYTFYIMVDINREP